MSSVAGTATEGAAGTGPRVLFRRRSPGRPPQSDMTDVRTFHRSLDGYAMSPLVPSANLADELGIGHLDVKLETDRLGLPSFKIMGAAWATMVALRDHLPPSWTPDHGLRGLSGSLPDLTLVAATDGNHGRALARVARLIGLQSRIFAPTDLGVGPRDSITAEGAEVVVVDGTYDDAVARSAIEGEHDACALVSDTSWKGYETVPAAVVDGYSTIFAEVDDQLEALGRPTPDLVLVQIGVGSFAAAVIRHFGSMNPRPQIVGVEPTAAACAMASLAAGQRVTLTPPMNTVMAGLNCGTPSYLAWPDLQSGLNAVVALDDIEALRGVERLRASGLEVGECSGVALAAAELLLRGEHSAAYRSTLDLPPNPQVLIFATEGRTSGSAGLGPNHAVASN